MAARKQIRELGPLYAALLGVWCCAWIADQYPQYTWWSIGAATVIIGLMGWLYLWLAIRAAKKHP
jgi:hypothetical protein